MTTAEKKFFRDWIRMMCGHPDAYVAFTMDDDTVPKVNRKIYYKADGTVVKVDNVRFRFPSNFHYATNILKYFDKEKQELIARYGIALFVILHEIGHIVRAKEQNMNVRKQEFAKVNKEKNFFLQGWMYRNTTPEKLADNFAFDWMRNNHKLALQISRKLKDCGVK